MCKVNAATGTLSELHDQRFSRLNFCQMQPPQAARLIYSRLKLPRELPPSVIIMSRILLLLLSSA